MDIILIGLAVLIIIFPLLNIREIHRLRKENKELEDENFKLKHRGPLLLLKDKKPKNDRKDVYIMNLHKAVEKRGGDTSYNEDLKPNSDELIQSYEKQLPKTIISKIKKKSFS